LTKTKKGALSEFFFGASPSQVAHKELRKEFQRLEEKVQTLKQNLNTFEIDKERKSNMLSDAHKAPLNSRSAIDQEVGIKSQTSSKCQTFIEISDRRSI
jgi:hypothetical protein